MYENHSKTPSKQQFKYNLRNYQTNFQINDWELIVTAFALRQALLYVGVFTPVGLQKQKAF